MNIKFITLIIISVFISSCDQDNLELNNCQDENDACYLYPIQNFEADSYSPLDVILYGTNLDQSEAMYVERKKNTIPDTSFVIYKNDEGLFIDDISIMLNQTYTYKVRNFSDVGFSDADSLDVNHYFPGIDSDLLIINPRNENSVDIDWSYDLNESFIKSYDEILWTIIRSKKPQYTNDWVDDFIFEILQNTEDNDYSFYDDNDIDLYDSLKYSVYLELDEIQSDITTKRLRVNFPKMEFIDWIPINSHDILIHWKIDDTNNDNVTSVKITNNHYRSYWGENEYFYEIDSGDIEDYLIDTLSNYYPDIVADTPVDYRIKWCGISACDSLDFTASTFRFKDMQYIPAMSNVPFDENNQISTEAFYIDIYEVNEDLYTNPEHDPEHEAIINYPKSSISIESARDWCSNGRSSDNNSNILNQTPALSDFRLPTESEWYVAAAIEYDINNDQIKERYDYTVQVENGIITCAFGNILNCSGESPGPFTVGYYNGDNSPEYQKSISPNGLYDCNGNVKEWTEKSENFPHPNGLGNVIMSGDFLSPEVNAKNNYLEYESEEFFEHSTIGFRTVITAPPPINVIDDE